MMRKNKELDLWLNEEDLQLVNLLTERYNISIQRILETALTHVQIAGLPEKPNTKYRRVDRIRLHLDGLAQHQLTQAATNGYSKQDVLRLGLKLFSSILSSDTADEKTDAYDPITEAELVLRNRNYDRLTRRSSLSA